MNNENVIELRKRIDNLNIELLEILSERALLVQQIGALKRKKGIYQFDPEREKEMLAHLARKNKGPFDSQAICHLFKEIFKVSLDLLVDEHKNKLLVSRESKASNTVISFPEVDIGAGQSQIIAGPCSVESEEQVIEVAKALKKNGVQFIRGGAYKPRTSPYDFQGLGKEGLRILRRVANHFQLKVVSEIMNVRDLESSEPYLDVIQIGARNMQNVDLLKSVGKMRIPILLKRGLAATIEELIFAAEYIVSQGNGQVILCERGIRTFEKWTRNTLDISAVPILKNETHLPVIVDISHAAGRRDILLPCAKAALAAGADGVMVEVHPNPSVALSDAKQQLDISKFEQFMKDLNVFRNSQEPKELSFLCR